MRVVEASEDLTAFLGEDLDTLCSLLPVRWGPREVLMRQVALSGNRPVGQITVLKESLTREVYNLLAANGVDGRNVVECADLVVLSLFRKQGVGRSLIQAVMDAVRGQELRLVALVPPDSHDSRQAFLGCGWSELEFPQGVAALLSPALKDQATIAGTTAVVAAP